MYSYVLCGFLRAPWHDLCSVTAYLIHHVVEGITFPKFRKAILSCGMRSVLWPFSNQSNEFLRCCSRALIVHRVLSPSSSQHRYSIASPSFDCPIVLYYHADSTSRQRKGHTWRALWCAASGIENLHCESPRGNQILGGENSHGGRS